MANNICKNCRVENPENATFCHSCGKEIILPNKKTTVQESKSRKPRKELSKTTTTTNVPLDQNPLNEKNSFKKIMLIAISKDGNQLNVEAINNDTCGSGPRKFQEGERTFYR